MKSILVSLLLIEAAVSARAQQQPRAVCLDSPGLKQIELDADYPSLLNLLFEVGSVGNICIAFEGYDSRVFDSKIHLTKFSGNVRQLLETSLKQFPEYCVAVDDRIVRVARCSYANDTWLDYRISSISWDKNFLQAISNGLYFSLSNQLKPSPSSFGHFRSGVVSDVIGPYNLKNETIRVLLNRFVGDSTGAMWFTNRPFDRRIGSPKQETPQQFWSVLEYHDNHQLLQGNLEQMRVGAAAEFLSH